MLPAYIGSHAATEWAGVSSSHGDIARRANNNGASNTADTSATLRDPSSSALHVAKAWEAGQRAARHFLAARAYFAPFEHGPTSVIVALDLCNLYLFLAEMGATASGGGGGGGGRLVAAAKDLLPSSASSAGPGDDRDCTVPIPSLPGGCAGGTEPALSGRSGLTNTGTEGGGGGEAGAGRRLRPTATVRFQCLEGALRALLDTQSVFAEAGVGLILAAATAAGAGQPQDRLTRLLESVMERLPKVLQGLVRASAASPSSSSSPSTTSVFKSMYRTSLMALRGGREGGSQTVLARLAQEYEAVGQPKAFDEK